MSTLSSIQARIQETGEYIHRFESLLVQNPKLKSASINLAALHKLYAKLEHEFQERAAAQGVDVCKYRLFSDGERENLIGLASAWIEFQHLFSIVYDTLTSGIPRRRSGVSDPIANVTQFGVAYSFPGSVGVALTLPNEAMLVESRIDHAMQTVFRMAKAGSAGEIAAHVRTMGPAPVRVLYRWADSHASNGLGAEIQWRRRNDTRESLFMETQDMSKLASLITTTGDESRDTIDVVGTLVAIDASRRTFKLVLEKNNTIAGEFGPTIDRDHTVTVPALYAAKVVRISRPVYSSDEDDITYQLIELKRRG